MPFETIPLDRPIHEKVAWADLCFHQFGDFLLRDQEIVEHLEELRKAIRRSRNAMIESGVVENCRDCEEREGGSCCGAGLEEHYGGILLLINRLLRVRLPKKRRDPDSCLFLTETGCLLAARHVICVNYLCKKITDRIDPEKIALLREMEGRELECLFLFQERIKRRLNGLKAP